MVPVAFAPDAGSPGIALTVSVGTIGRGFSKARRVRHNLVKRRSEPDADLASSASRRSGRLAWPGAVLLAVFCVHLWSPNTTLADSHRFVPAAESLVSHGSFDVRWSLRVPGGNTAHGLYPNPPGPVGPLYPYYPLGPALLAVPVVAVGHVSHFLGLTRSIRADLLGGTWPLERLIATIVVTATAGVMYLLGLLVLPAGNARRRGSAAAFALTFAFATSAWSTASRALWQHGPSMLFLSLALLIAVRGEEDDERPALLGLVLGLAYVMRPSNAIAIVTFTAWIAVSHRRRLPPHLVGLASVLVPLAIVNMHLYGAVLPPYYRSGAQGSNPHFLTALAGNLISPARGLFVFSPILLLAVVGAWRRLAGHSASPLDICVWTTIFAHWLLISRSVNWWGGHSIGPRLFSDMVPLLMYAALPALTPTLGRRSPPSGIVRSVSTASVVVLLAVSVVVQFEGATMSSMWCWNVVPTNVDDTPQRVWSMSPPQFLAGFASLAGKGTWRSESVRHGILAPGGGCHP